MNFLLKPGSLKDGEKALVQPVIYKQYIVDMPAALVVFVLCQAAHNPVSGTTL